jgi:hypothetical protein
MRASRYVAGLDSSGAMLWALARFRAAFTRSDATEPRGAGHDRR